MAEKDILARERTLMAKERTLLSYVRTGIAFVGLGLILLRFFPPSLWVVVDASLILVGLGMMAKGMYDYRRVKAQEEELEKELGPKDA